MVLLKKIRKRMNKDICSTRRQPLVEFDKVIKYTIREFDKN